MAKKKKSRAKIRMQLILLWCISFLISVVPLIVLMGYRWEVYVKQISDAIKLALGGIVLVIFLILKILGKLKMPRRVITFTLVFLMVCLLEPLILDLKIITAVALGSEVIDYLLLQRPIKYLKEELLVDRTADATANKVEEIVTRIMASNTSNGRV